MPIFPVNNSKLVVLNEEKTRGIVLEFPVDMLHEEVIQKIDELRTAIVESKKKLDEEKKEETKTS